MLTYSRLAYQAHDHQRCIITALERARGAMRGEPCQTNPYSRNCTKNYLGEPPAIGSLRYCR